MERWCAGVIDAAGLARGEMGEIKARLKELCAMEGGEVLLTQSGAETVELAVKLARAAKRSVGADRPRGLRAGRRRRIAIRCASATESELAPNRLDAVFTDPPYFGNVQYGELMDFCYVWLRRLAGSDAEGFDRPSTRSPQELTGNVTQERGLEHFTEGLATVWSRMARALKPGAPPAFTYHHNKLDA